jgi:hypothetical protein
MRGPEVKTTPISAKIGGMIRTTILISVVLFSAACSGTDPASGTDQSISNAVSTSNSGSSPPGTVPDQIELQEIQPPQVVTMEKGKPGEAPTPGIPGPDELKKPFKPGTKPTPGIPDEKTIKKMLSEPVVNANVRQQ